MKQLYHFLEEQEKFFMASLEELGQTIGHVRESYSTRASRDIALLNELIGEMEVKQSQPEWELMQVSVVGPGLPLPAVPSRTTWAPGTAIVLPKSVQDESLTSRSP